MSGKSPMSERVGLQERIARLGETPQQYHQRREAAYREATARAEVVDRAGADARSDREAVRRATWRILAIDPTSGTADAETHWVRSRADAEPGYRRSRFSLVARPAGNIDDSVARPIMLGTELEVLEES